MPATYRILSLGIYCSLDFKNGVDDMGDEKQINQERANSISKLSEAASIAANDRFALFRTHNGGAYSYSFPYSRLVQ